MTAVKIVYSINKCLLDQATKPTKHKQTNNTTIFFSNWNIQSLKTGRGQIRKQDLRRHRRMRYHQAKCARDTANFEFIMNQGSNHQAFNECVDKVVNGEKILVPSAIPLLSQGQTYRVISVEGKNKISYSSYCCLWCECE